MSQAQDDSSSQSVEDTLKYAGTLKFLENIYQSPVHPVDRGTLYLVPTPIGNIEDLTLRGLRILSSVDWIAAEDTRHTGLLLHRLGIKKRLISTHQHNEASSSQGIINLLSQGTSGALVSDAGTPGISDPGQRIVAELIKSEFKVVALPGACALTTTLSASGIISHEFFFSGFLPVKSGQRLRKMQSLAELKTTIILYESPHKMPRLLGELDSVFQKSPIIIGREISKKFEEYLRGSGSELNEKFQNRKWKGELVVIIDNNH